MSLFPINLKVNILNGSFFSKCIPFLILFSLVCLPDIAINLIQGKLAKMLTGFLFVSSVFLLPAVFIRKYLKFYTFLLAFIAFSSLLAAIPIFYFGLIINESIMQLAYNTNYQEALELFRGFVVPIALIFVLFLIVVIFIVGKIPNTISASLSRRVSFLSLILILTIPIAKYGFSSYIKNLKITAYHYYPFYVLYFGNKFVRDIQLKKAHPQLVKNFKFHAKRPDTIPRRQIYVLIIGESSRYDHWNINGYSRNTSPKLSAEARLLSYKRVCAAGGMTELSVPMLITQTPPQHYMDHVYKKSIVSLFKEAGFSTWWISNQVDHGNIMMYANEADHKVMLQTIPTAREDIHYDMELIHQMKKAIQSDTGNLFIIVHTLGSHFNYTFRYLPDYDIFQPSGQNTIIKPFKRSLKEEYINGYDNSILYSDAVIDRAIRLIDKNNWVSAMYYISDHGENLYDDERNLFAHANNIPSKYIAHVPLFIFTSNAYHKFFPKKCEQLKSHLESNIDGQNTFNTLADMANIRFNGLDLSKSLASSKFIDAEQWILGTDRRCYRYNELK